MVLGRLISVGLLLLAGCGSDGSAASSGLGGAGGAPPAPLLDPTLFDRSAKQPPDRITSVPVDRPDLVLRSLGRHAARERGSAR